ncbi:carbohydrate binding domain-containing protein [Actinocorallia longicatena]|uniref:Fibronectin type-III domain-containing protein n=1 Tax=Actinocorallia longicatena TaxID=111803 RepID=A0ABP6QR57_9ACTN
MHLSRAAVAVVTLLGGVLLPATAAHAANIASNPGFENGLSGWTCSASSGAAAVSSPVHTGSGALTATPAGDDLARCRQTVGVKPSSAYTLSAWVRGNYVFLGATGTGGTDPQTWAAPGATWTKVSTTFTTGPSASTVTVYLNGWYGQGAYAADDVVLDGPGGTTTPVDTAAPTVPGGVSAGSPTSSSLNVTWTASTDDVGVTGYDVLRSGTSTPVTVSGTSYTATGLAANTAYSFQVRARDAAGNTSAYSAAAGGTTSTTTTPPPANITFAPYIDITFPTPSLASVRNATGQKYFTLAFALGDSTGCNPAWGGTIPLNDSRIINDVRALQAAGGQVIVATGGAAGPYLEHVCGTSASLLAAYENVLDTVGTNHLDVDIEASIDVAKVNTALKQLQAERGTTISYTLRIQGQDYGIDPFSVQILQDAAAKGLEVLVNPMLMDFGFTGDWGDALVSAASATLGQMKTIWPGRTDARLRRMLGLTPMIGKNDTGPITTQADARKLLAFAQSNHVGRIGFWSIGRDNGGCPGGTLSPTCSGVAQSAYEFTSVFSAFTG